MDTHPIQASPQRWIVALGLLLVAGVQGLFLWVHSRWYMGFLVGRNGCNSAVCPIGLLGMVCSRLCPYFHYYAFYHYIRHILYFGGQFLYPVDLGVY